jgi:DUF2946 family protein
MILGTTMSRRLQALIPFILLAVMVQLFAPIAAFRAVANAVSDPLYMATICSGMASAQDGSQTSPVKPQHGASCCGFCSVGHGGAVAVDPPPLIFAVLQRQYQLITWLEATNPIPPVRAGRHAQARAPPSFS